MAATPPHATNSTPPQLVQEQQNPKRMSVSSAMARITITSQPSMTLELAPSEVLSSLPAASPPSAVDLPALSAAANLSGASPAEHDIIALVSTEKVLEVPKRNISEVSSPNLVPDGQSKRLRLDTGMVIEDSVLEAPVTMSPLALTADYGSDKFQDPPTLDLASQGEPALPEKENNHDATPSAQPTEAPQLRAEPPEQPPEGDETIEMDGTGTECVEQNGVSLGPSAGVQSPQSGEDEEEEEESEEWELGPDGLRLPSDVVENLYDEREDSARRCRICVYVSMLLLVMNSLNNLFSSMRFEGGVDVDEPLWLIDSLEEDRIAHCIEKHLDVWNNVRAGLA
jgi:hypothetical protein